VGNAATRQEGPGVKRIITIIGLVVAIDQFVLDGELVVKRFRALTRT
jgi:hypothetical protein